jgi:hypothetical protein
MKQKIVLVALLATTSSLMATGGEFAYLYKDPRIMGMGGANISVGAYSTSVFSNPAGLANISKEDGFVIDILSLGVSGSEKTSDFANDLNDAIDTDDTDEIVGVLSDYDGEPFSYNISNYTSISKNSDLFAWSVGFLAATDINIVSHGNNSDGLLESNSRGYGGIILGVAKPFDTDYGRFDIGVGAKFIMQQSYEGTLTVTDLTGDDVVDTLRDKFEQESSGFGIDLGVTYHPFEQSSWHPAFGLSVLNIGSMGMDDNYGFQPTTVNIGASISPEVSYIESLVVAIDYVDLFNENIIRDYTFSDGDEVTWTDYEDSDFMKRLRLGVGVGLFKSSYFSTNISAGLYQGAYTAGIDMEVTILKLNLATYEEQIGTGDVDIADRRYMLQLALGW